MQNIKDITIAIKETKTNCYITIYTRIVCNNNVIKSNIKIIDYIKNNSKIKNR